MAKLKPVEIKEHKKTVVYKLSYKLYYANWNIINFILLCILIGFQIFK
jgi:hypothetical protein